MKNVKARVRVPKTAKAGETFTIKTLISHPMISGQGKDKQGKPIPRDIINHFSCDFEGQSVLAMELDPAISANPFIEFEAKVDKSGTFKFTWKDDDGSVYDASASIEVG